MAAVGYPARLRLGFLLLISTTLFTLGEGVAAGRAGEKEASNETASPKPEPDGTSSGASTEGSADPARSDSAAAERAEPGGGAREAKTNSGGGPPLAEPPQPPPPNVEPIPATAVKTPYIEHLGPDSFPGRLRGLYGGSLWLEPSFAGLQWPYLAHTGVGVSGNVWVDSGYETIRRGSEQIPNSSMYLQSGRGVLRLTPTYVSGLLFVQGQIELVGNLCQATSNVCTSSGTFATDDLWVRVGYWNRWDLKVGRFEAWEVYHLGMGLEPFTIERLGAGNFGVDTFTTPPLEAPAFYAVNFLHDRPTEGLAVGYAALHAYPTQYLRFELLAKLGSDNYRSDNSTGDTASTEFGGRPAAIFDVGWLKLKVAAEYQKRTPITQTVEPGMPGHKKNAVAGRVLKGAGASLQFVIDPIVEFGLNGAIGRRTETDAFARTIPELSYTTISTGGFVNFRVAELWLLGVGVNYTAQTDSVLATGSTANDFTSQLQAFVALQFLLAGQLFIKPEVAFARAHFQPSDVAVATWNNDMWSGRIRLMYLF